MTGADAVAAKCAGEPGFALCHIARSECIVFADTGTGHAVGTGLIILFSSPQTVVGRLLGTKLLVGIGLISYSAYLWHYPEPWLLGTSYPLGLPVGYLLSRV